MNEMNEYLLLTFVDVTLQRSLRRRRPFRQNGSPPKITSTYPLILEIRGKPFINHLLSFAFFF